MAYKHWTLDDLPWDRFERDKVDPDQEKIIRAAAMVEYNAPDYVTYLCNVFGEDSEFCQAAVQWGQEEVQHGQALGGWAAVVDPEFDFEQRFRRFREGYKLDLETDTSIRGTRPAELVARCMVEVGTSSYYTALGDSTEEPLLRAICRKIASDELRHYKLFYDHLKRYLSTDRLNRLQRIRVALRRIAETEDDELSYAYYAANVDEGPYDRDTFNNQYMRRAYSYYRSNHIDRVTAMVFKACGLKPHTTLFNATRVGAWWLMQRKQKRLSRIAA